MAEEKENTNNKDNQNITNSIDKILNSFDINHGDCSIKNDSLWSFPDNLVDSQKYTKRTLDVDYYWNFNGTVNPRIDVEFYVGNDTWVNINELSTYNKSFSTINNNNYIVSANITDNGPKELDLVLYDRNFTDLQKLIATSISFVDKNLNSKEENENEFSANIVNGTNLSFFTSPTKITTNIRIRYGYNDNRDAKINKNWNYKGVGDFSDDETEKSRWRSTETENEISDEDENKQSLSTEITLSHHNQQTTLLSNWEYFFITGLNSTLSNSGIKYSIKGISSEEFALNGYKMYQQYSVIKGKPKSVLASLMNMFNNSDTKGNSSPIKLVWADEDVHASDSAINGQDLLLDYETGKYKLVGEKERKTIADDINKPISDLNKYITMLMDIKACFVNMSNNNLKSYVGGKDVEYTQNIDKITINKNYYEESEKAQKASFADLIMWPLNVDPNYRLEATEYGSSLKKMARFQNDVSKNYDFLIDLTKNKSGGRDKRSIVYIKDLMKIWLANIAIGAYNLGDDGRLNQARQENEKLNSSIDSLKNIHTKLNNDIENINNNMMIRWKIEVPDDLEDDDDIEDIDRDKLDNNKYYVSDGKTIEVIKRTSSKHYEEMSINSLTDSRIKYSFYESNDGNGRRVGLGDLDDYYNNKNSNHLSNLYHYLHNKYINDIFFFKWDSEKIIKEFLDNPGWGNEGEVINLSKVYDFFKDNLKESVGESGLAYALGKIDTVHIDDKDEKYNKYNKIKSLLEKMENLSFDYENIKSNMKSDIMYKESSIGISKNKKFFIMKPDRTWIFNDFSLDDLKYENIEFRKEGYNHMNVKVNGGYIRVNVTLDVAYNENQDGYPIAFCESFLKYLKSILSLILDLLNKNKTILEVKIFENNETWGKLSLDYNVEEEYVKYLKKQVNVKLNNNYEKSNIKVQYINFERYHKIAEEKNESLEDAKLRETLNNLLKDISEEGNDKANDLKDIIDFRVGGKKEEIEKFGTFNNENLLISAFDIINNLSIGSDSSSNNAAIENLLKKIDTKVSNLSEVLKGLNQQKEIIDDSNTGKEIELSLGSQNSRNSKTKITKTIASLLNDFCSQCEPKISQKELDLKNVEKENNENQNQITIKDESGEDKIVEMYQDLPRYNLTWGVIGWYYGSSNDKKLKKDGIPVIGLYYKKPKNISKLRIYNWGIGNNKPHCVKDVSLSTGSEFALMHAYNTVTKTNNGQILNTVDQTMGVSAETKNVIPYKQPCFFNEYFDTERDKNMFNNMINSISKGTITLLGDPSLRFSGSIQPYTYPIYLNIKLEKENNSWYNEKSKKIEYVNLTEASQLTGYYVITKITHNISISGYTTTLEVMKFPGSGDSFNNYIQL